MKELGQQPAFPISKEETDKIDQGISIYTGVSKRLYIATAIMQGLVANSNPGMLRYTKAQLAQISLEHADELIEQINQ